MNGFILTITSLIMRGAGLIFNIYIANQVGQEAIGIFSLVMSVYSFAITFATSGISLACTCIVSEEFEKKDFTNGLRAVRTCIFFSLILGLSSTLLLFLFAPIISSNWLNDSVSTTPIYAISLGLPLISISSVIGGYFSSVGKSYKSAISQCFELLIKIIATVFLLKYTINKGIDAICSSLILGDVISEFFSFSLNLILYYFDRKKLGAYRSYTKDMGKRIFKISFPVAITSYIRSGLSSLKQFLIPVRLQTSGLNYSLAISKYGLINGMVMPVLMFANFFISSFSTLLVPEYARLLAGKNFNRMKTVCNKIFDATFVFSFLVAGIFLFFANELSLAIYQNLDAAPYIRLLVPLVVFMYIDNIIDSMLKGVNSQFGVMCINISDLIITILIIYFVVPVLGVNGYVLSIFVSEIFNFTASLILLKKKIAFHFDFWCFCLKPCLVVFVAYLISRLLAFPCGNFIVYVVLKIGSFALIYMVLLVVGHFGDGAKNDLGT